MYIGIIYVSGRFREENEKYETVRINANDEESAKKKLTAYVKFLNDAKVDQESLTDEYHSEFISYDTLKTIDKLYYR